MLLSRMAEQGNQFDACSRSGERATLKMYLHFFQNDLLAGNTYSAEIIAMCYSGNRFYGYKGSQEIIDEVVGFNLTVQYFSSLRPKISRRNFVNLGILVFINNGVSDLSTLFKLLKDFSVNC